jgi:hypothetical protein
MLLCTYKTFLGLDERSIRAVHLVVEAAGVAEVVAVPVPPPEGGGGSTAIHTFPTLCNGRHTVDIGVQSLSCLTLCLKCKSLLVRNVTCHCTSILAHAGQSIDP